MGISKTLDGRLLCAAECAYTIETNYFRGVGYQKGTKTHRISKGVNSCLVGRTVDGIVVAFRGTDGFSPGDWLQNAAVFLKDVDHIPGRVHGGFFNAIDALYEPIKKILLHFIKESSSWWTLRPKIYLTGHSKGGCLASLMAVLIQMDPDLPTPHYVCTFGAARVGDADFQSYYNRNIHQTSYENYLDIIPFLPPGDEDVREMHVALKTKVNDIMWPKDKKRKRSSYFWNYRPIGLRKFIDPDGHINSNVTHELDRQRIHDIETKTMLSFAEFRRAHCIACPDHKPNGATCSGGYFCAIAPEICKEDSNRDSKLFK